jgi:hypothetical protein
MPMRSLGESGGGARRRLAIRAPLLGVLTTALLFPVISLAGATAAQAATCTSWRSQTVTGDVSKVTYQFSNHCSDGLAHVTGTVYDTKCDARQAQALISVDTQPLIGGAYFDWS